MNIKDDDMKRYIIFGFDDYSGTDLKGCIQGVSDALKDAHKLGVYHKIGNRDIYCDTIQALDTHSGTIWEWEHGKWSREGNMYD